MEKIPAWIERMLLPKLNEITGEIKAIHTRIDSVEKEIVSFCIARVRDTRSQRTEVRILFSILRFLVLVYHSKGKVVKLEISDYNLCSL